MRSTGFDAARLDVASFARLGGALEGRLPLSRLVRLSTSTLAPSDGEAGEAAWSAHGLWQRPVGAEPEIRLHLQARATVHLQCQRCLQPVAQVLQVDRTIRFVAGEDLAAQLDEQLDEDVLALPRLLDLADLIEDELILALPIVPMHEVCPQPLVHDAEAGADIAEDKPEPAHPFAALAVLKSRS